MRATADGVPGDRRAAATAGVSLSAAGRACAHGCRRRPLERASRRGGNGRIGRARRAHAPRPRRLCPADEGGRASRRTRSGLAPPGRRRRRRDRRVPGGRFRRLPERDRRCASHPDRDTDRSRRASACAKGARRVSATALGAILGTYSRSSDTSSEGVSSGRSRRSGEGRRAAEAGSAICSAGSSAAALAEARSPAAGSAAIRCCGCCCRWWPRC